MWDTEILSGHESEYRGRAEHHTSYCQTNKRKADNTNFVDLSHCYVCKQRGEIKSASSFPSFISSGIEIVRGGGGRQLHLCTKSSRKDGWASFFDPFRMNSCLGSDSSAMLSLRKWFVSV